MPGKESFLAILREQQEEMRLKGEEFNKAKLQWEDWGRLLPRLASFAKREIGRRSWRGKRSGVLPEGHDAKSIAAEVIARAFEGKARLAVGWTFERLEKELERLVRHEVRRLHKLKEAHGVRSEWEVLPPGGNGQARSVLAGIVDAGSRDGEQEIGEWFEIEDELVAKVFGCLCEGVVKRREIAARLGISVAEVTNCRKRLNRKLGRA